MIDSVESSQIFKWLRKYKIQLLIILLLVTESIIVFDNLIQNENFFTQSPERLFITNEVNYYFINESFGEIYNYSRISQSNFFDHSFYAVVETNQTDFKWQIINITFSRDFSSIIDYKSLHIPINDSCIISGFDCTGGRFYVLYSDLKAYNVTFEYALGWIYRTFQYQFLELDSLGNVHLNQTIPLENYFSLEILEYYGYTDAKTEYYANFPNPSHLQKVDDSLYIFITCCGYYGVYGWETKSYFIIDLPELTLKKYSKINFDTRIGHKTYPISNSITIDEVGSSTMQVLHDYLVGYDYLIMNVSTEKITHTITEIEGIERFGNLSNYNFIDRSWIYRDKYRLRLSDDFSNELYRLNNNKVVRYLESYYHLHLIALAIFNTISVPYLYNINAVIVPTIYLLILGTIIITKRDYIRYTLLAILIFLLYLHAFTTWM